MTAPAVNDAPVPVRLVPAPEKVPAVAVPVTAKLETVTLDPATPVIEVAESRTKGESPMAVGPEKYASLPAVPEPVIVPAPPAVQTPPVMTPLESVAVFQYPEQAADDIPEPAARAEAVPALPLIFAVTVFPNEHRPPVHEKVEPPTEKALPLTAMVESVTIAPSTCKPFATGVE